MIDSKSNKDYRKILGIESAIFGGSLSLCGNQAEFDSWVGEQDVSRAEDLLPSMHRLLKQHSLEVGDLSAIIVSTGPGSYTGIRVGLATVLGLRAALGVPCLGMTALQAISGLHVGEQPVIAAVPMGRDLVCVQTFQNCVPISEPRVVSEAELTESMLTTGFAVVAHAEIYAKLSDLKHDISIIDAGRNIASYLCLGGRSNQAITDLSPLFVERNSV